MISITAADAILLVRKNLDEVQGNDSDMAGLDDIDSNNFEEIIMKTLPEAINEVNLSAPVEMLSGKVISNADLNNVDIDDNKVLTIPVTGFLRLVAFQPFDSPYSVSNPVGEFSAEGRMQLNRYTRATPESPVLVKVNSVDHSDTETGRTIFKYYGLSSVPSSDSQAIKVFRYVERYKYEDKASDTLRKATSYNVSDLLADVTIDRLTGMVAKILNDSRADYFLARSSFQATEEQKNDQ